ncbi:MAG: DUF4623 domain-containing protein [bacterium]|nr:DUF4623 domain-containing protein [bacterium]
MNRTIYSLATAAFLVGTTTAQGLAPLSTFGTNGWLAPGAISALNTSSTERGFSYNPITGNLVLVSRAGGDNLRVLDGSTGADLGGLDVTGVTGGTFRVNMCDIGEDGAIYVGNLAIGANFKVYKWDSESTGMTTPPSVAFDAPPGMSRVGDSFAVFGGATSPAIFAAAGSANALNSGFVSGALDGSNTSTAYTSIPGTGTGSNDYRLSLSFVDSTTLIGNQGGLARYTTFNPGLGTATVVDSIGLGGAAQRGLDYAVINGTPVLACIDSNSSLVSVFDITIPASPVLLATANNTSGTLSGNGNGSGDLQWGRICGDSATLYAMNTNQGIQAFNFTLAPAAAATQFGTGCGSPVPDLDASGAPLLPSSITLTASNLSASLTGGFWAIGFGSFPAGQQIPIAAPGCNQYVTTDATSFVFTGGASSVTLGQTFPSDPCFSGLSIFYQGVFFDGAFNISVTNGLDLALSIY